MQESFSGYNYIIWHVYEIIIIIEVETTNLNKIIAGDILEQLLLNERQYCLKGFKDYEEIFQYTITSK